MEREGRVTGNVTVLDPLTASQKLPLRLMEEFFDLKPQKVAFRQSRAYVQALVFLPYGALLFGQSRCSDDDEFDMDRGQGIALARAVKSARRDETI